MSSNYRLRIQRYISVIFLNIKNESPGLTRDTHIICENKYNMYNLYYLIFSLGFLF